jgi:hypothetical protein
VRLGIKVDTVVPTEFAPVQRRKKPSWTTSASHTLDDEPRYAIHRGTSSCDWLSHPIYSARQSDRLAKAEIPLFGTAFLARRCKKSLKPRPAHVQPQSPGSMICFSALVTWDYSILGGKTLGANLQGYQSKQPMVVETWRFDFLHLDIRRGVAAALG